MLSKLTSLSSLLLLLTLPLGQSIITPTSPDSTTTVKVGDTIQALWDVDTTGTWTDVTCQLMTGDNYQMIALSTLGQGIDGTTTTSLSFVAPDVTPNAEIYFLQFSNGGDLTNLTWTTRFTIAASDGSTTEPTNTTVYNGVSVNWGTGILATSSDSDSTSTSNSTTSSETSDAATLVAPSTVASSSIPSTSGMTLYNSDDAQSTTTASASTASTSTSASAGVSLSAAKASQSISSAGKSIGMGMGGGFMSITIGGAMMLVVGGGAAAML
ncbi:hypothetical protein BCR39DRAFT_58663 [Naematelia encephala]|uniref:Ser-Thr-rich glycosyl-phosphatidyl-inositol-anchored membrane family-domain-containing protein n=1 Tax=Naematelia encephala TaxID=71784 RepID=A0A1Y2BB79_9TREE|nr:hypothetical protein BCR39DRAFT_58663 [Naematelia encephala]